MNEEKLCQYNFRGKDFSLKYIDSSEVTSGVRCDVYRFPEDSSKDLGVVFIKAGYKTPLQRVLKGEITIESFYYGKGTLTIRKENGEKDVYDVDDKLGESFSREVEIGEIMQWQAAPDSELVVCEVCYPPYEEGRYENLEE